MPSLEEFEQQLRRSITEINSSNGDCIFDRCPFDLLAYLLTHEDAEGFDLKHWIQPVKGAVKKLDLIVFVPIEDPDRVLTEESAFAGLRQRVHDEIEQMVIGDRLGFEVPAIEVTGSVEERAKKVIGMLIN